MDITIILGQRELRKNQLIITCEAPNVPFPLGSLMSDVLGHDWVLSYIECLPQLPNDFARIRVYFDPVLSETPTYSEPATRVLSSEGYCM